MPHFKRQREQLQQFFDQYAPAAAQQSHFSQRQSKLTGSLFAKILVLGWLQDPTGSLTQLTHVAQEFGVTLTRQGLDERFKPETVMFWALLFARSLTQFRAQADLKPSVFAHFSAVRLIDSTQIALPSTLRELFADCGTGQASLKTQLCFEYLSGGLEAVDWEAGRNPDQNCRLPQLQASPGSVQVFDLGYFNQQMLAAIAQQDAFFVCRLQSQTAVYTPAGDRLDLATQVSTLPRQPQELSVQIGRLTHLPVRLLLYPVSAAVAAQRRRKAKARKAKQTCSVAYLALLDWELFITNVPADWLNGAEIRQLYRLRWQIELIFKVWKSQLHLAQVGHWRAERLLCQLYARFTGLVLCHWLIAPDRFLQDGELSLCKAFQVILHHLPTLRRVVAHRWYGLLAFLTQLRRDFRRFARKEPRRKSPSTLTRLIQLQTLKP